MQQVCSFWFVVSGFWFNRQKRDSALVYFEVSRETKIETRNQKPETRN